jgi:hypothetical protein
LLAGPTVLKEGRTLVPLRRTAHWRAGESSGATLTIEGLDFDAPPRVLYEVRLQSANGRRALVGVLNFYNRTASGYGAGPATAGAETRTFDATAALRAIGGEAAFLLFEPTAGVTGVVARVNPGARVRFTSAAIRRQ